jgi:hypothetical protein
MNEMVAAFWELRIAARNTLILDMGRVFGSLWFTKIAIIVLLCYYHSLLLDGKYGKVVWRSNREVICLILPFHDQLLNHASTLGFPFLSVLV